MKDLIEKFKKMKLENDDSYVYDEACTLLENLSRGDALILLEWLEKNYYE